MLQNDPARRMTALAALRHPFVFELVQTAPFAPIVSPDNHSRVQFPKTPPAVVTAALPSLPFVTPDDEVSISIVAQPNRDGRDGMGCAVNGQTHSTVVGGDERLQTSSSSTTLDGVDAESAKSKSCDEIVEPIHDLSVSQHLRQHTKRKRNDGMTESKSQLMSPASSWVGEEVENEIADITSPSPNQVPPKVRRLQSTTSQID